MSILSGSTGVFVYVWFIIFLWASQVQAQCPGLDFSATKRRACIFDVINLIPVNLPTGGQVQWVIGADTANAVDTLGWIFNKTGVFDVELIVTSGGPPCKVKKTGYITIGSPVVNPPIIVASKTVCSLNDTLTISNNTPNAFRHSWSIGMHYYPDTSGTIRHLFSDTGYFKINLKLVDSNGCVALNSLDSIYVIQAPALSIQPSQASFCAPDTISFNFTSNPSQTYSSVLWTFGGAVPSISNSAAPKGINYTGPGNYDVTIEITNSIGCSYKLKEDSLISVGTKHNLALQLSSHYVCNLEKFTGTTTFGNLDSSKFKWKLSNAIIDSVSKLDSQIISYASGGKKAVTLEYNDNGCISDTVDTVQVVVLTPDFIANKTCGCKVPLNVNFNANGTNYNGPGFPKYAWNFYNGSSNQILGSSNQKNPSFNYTVTGLHDVRLEVSDGNGCIKSILKNEFIRIDSLRATISANPLKVCPGQTVTFSTRADSTCQEGLNNFSWRFYDLNGTTLLDTSTSDRPAFNYASPGSYSVSLAIANQEGCTDSIKLQDAVTVGNLKADFEADDTILCSGSSTRFSIIDLTGISASAEWTITEVATGNVLLNTTTKSPKVSFPNTGFYSVKLVLRVVGSCKDSVTKTNYIRVNGITANITANDTGGCLPFSTTLHANVVNQNIGGNAGTVTINWFKPSGSALNYSNTSAANPGVSITAKGCYDVKLRVSNSGGCSFTEERQDFLCAGVSASFNTPVRACMKEAIKLTNTSSVNTVSFQWISSRPEGRFLPSETDSNPTFYASASGSYQIYLVARDTFNCTDTFSRVINIDLFEADFTSPDTGGQCSPAFISFEIIAAGADSFFWNFGDGQTLKTIQQITSNIYDLQNADSLNNFFDVSLIAKSTFGCYDTVKKFQFINVLGPFLKFTYLNKIGCEPLRVEFADSNESVLSFLFDYGDNSPISSNQVTSHIYAAKPTDTSTIYRPTIIATDNKGCVRQYTPADSIVVYKKPAADFMASATIGCEPFNVTFTNTSSFANKYYWDFENDGIFDDSTENPVHSFQAGTYSVKLVVESPYGCADTLVVQQLITSYVNPIAKMDFDTTVVCFLADVDFHDLSTGPAPLIKRWWNFGDTTLSDDTSSQKNPIYSYASPGFYAPSLIVEDDKGCRDTQIFSFVEVIDTVPLPYAGLEYVSVNAKNQVEIIWPNGNIRGFKHYLLFRQGLSFDTVKQETQTQLADTASLPQNGSICYDIQIQINCLTKSLLGHEHCTIWLQTQKGAEREIILTWTPYVGWPRVQEYAIFRDDKNGFIQIAKVNGNETSYIDNNLCNTEYCYYVVALHPSGYQSSSNRSCIMPDYKMQTAPLQLYRTTVENNEYTLTEWERGEDANISTYLIDRYSQVEGWIQDYASTINTNYFDNNVDVFKNPYLYRVRMENDCDGTSPESNPGTSILLSARDVNDQFLLTWTAYREFIQGVTAYHVEKVEDDGSFRNLATVSGNDTFLITADVALFETLNCYRVVAEENITGRLSISNIACNTLRSRIYVPSAFSPNNDSINDLFYVYGIFLQETGLDKVHDYELNIYNRWGEKLWTTNDIREGWNGKFHGELLPEGVYLYSIQATGVDRESFYLKGTVTLRR